MAAKKPAASKAAGSTRATSKRAATTPRKAPSTTPKPKAAQAEAVVDAAVAAAPASSKDNVVLVSIAKGLRVFHDAAGRRRFIAGGERFEIDAKTAKVLLADDESFALAVGLEPTDAGLPERLTTPAQSGAVTTEDLGMGGRIGAEAEQAKAEAEAEAAANKAAGASGDTGTAGDSDPSALSSALAPDPVGDEGAAASTLSPLEEAQDKASGDEPGATVLS